MGRSGLRRASERGSGEGGSSGGEVRVYDRRIDLGKELEELVCRVGVVLRYVRVGSVSVGDMSVDVDAIPSGERTETGRPYPSLFSGF